MEIRQYQQNCEEPISSLDPLPTFRESTTDKVSISDYKFNFVPVVTTSLIFCESYVNFRHFEMLPSFLY